MTDKKRGGRGPTEPARAPSTVKKRVPNKAKAAAAAESELNEALEQTFPASDPISLESTLVPGSRH